MKDCNQCGKCCINYSHGGLSASTEDIEGWQLFRPDIAEYVRDGQIWINPKNGQQLTYCPWLTELPEVDKHSPDTKKYSCTIYHDRPEDCRHFPVTIGQMVDNDCEMIELQDLQNIKQAQQTLDKLMSDSRPSLAANRSIE